MKALIQKLVETHGPSGYETKPAQPGAQPGGASRRRGMGRYPGQPDRPQRTGRPQGGLKIMLAAHMDEIGVIVTHIDEDGFVRFMPLGGVRPQNCLGGRVRFLNGHAA